LKLQALYKIGVYEANQTSRSLFGVVGFLEQYAKYDDLSTFLEKYATYAIGSSFNYSLVHGGLNLQADLQDADSEANLDVQYAVSLGWNIPVTFYSVGGLAPLVPDHDQPTQPGSNEPYLDFLEYMLSLSDEKLPQTITLSYGEDEQSVPEAYARQVCSMFGQLGARGVSVIFSSGDTGPGSACQTNNGKNTTRFLPMFPAACPWVTSVGATTGVEPEAAAYFSSGGFSDLFARPAYQASAISKYFGKLGNRWSGLYNVHGRGFPDVAAQGVNFHIVDKKPSTGVQMDILGSGTR
jgi:tripeptidyl-peptidase-1